MIPAKSDNITGSTKKHNSFRGTIVFFSLLLFASQLHSQNFIPSISNTLRYGSGMQTASGLSRQVSYFENLTDVRLSVQPSVTIGFRLLTDDPPEIGESFQGLKRRFVEFRQDGFFLRAGNFSEMFGRGLALNLFENRGLAYDTWMDGVKAQYRSDLFMITLLGGTIDFRDSVTVARFEQYKIRGVNIELYPLRGLTIGSTFLEANGYIPQFVGSKRVSAEIPEFYASFHFGSLAGFIGYARKWSTVVNEGTHNGDGVSASLSYAGKGIGIVIDYKDYRFDIRDPFDRGAGERPTRMLPFQNPPIAQKEHSYTLLTRALHQVDFNDETGIQVECFYSVSPSTMINLNASVANRHHYYEYNATTFLFTERKREYSFLPSIDRRLSP
jgi:hypothetical protein